MDCSTTNKTNKGDKSGGMQCDTSTSKIIYFELLDTNIIPSTNIIPRIKLWSTKIVQRYESIDSLGGDGCNYRRLPIKDINLPPFRRRSLQPSLSPEIPYELDQLLNAYSNASNHNKVNETRSEVHSMIKNLYQNMFNMIQPIIGKYLANITQLILASNDSVGHHDEANHLTEMSTELCIDDEQDQVGSHICTKLFHTQIIKTEDQGEPNAPTEQNHTHVISDGQGQCIRRIEETENCTILQLPVVDESQLDNQNFISLQLEDIFNDIRPHNVQRDFDIPINPNIINMVYSFAKEQTTIDLTPCDESNVSDISSLVSKELDDSGTRLDDSCSVQSKKIEEKVNFDNLFKPVLNETQFKNEDKSHNVSQHYISIPTIELGWITCKSAPTESVAASAKNRTKRTICKSFNDIASDFITSKKKKVRVEHMDSPPLTQQQQNMYNDTEEEWCSPEELKRFYESVTMLEDEYNSRLAKFISNT